MTRTTTISNNNNISYLNVLRTNLIPLSDSIILTKILGKPKDIFTPFRRSRCSVRVFDWLVIWCIGVQFFFFRKIKKMPFVAWYLFESIFLAFSSYFYHLAYAIQSIGREVPETRFASSLNSWNKTNYNCLSNIQNTQFYYFIFSFSLLMVLSFILVSFRFNFPIEKFNPFARLASRVVPCDFALFSAHYYSPATNTWTSWCEYAITNHWTVHSMILTSVCSA